MPKAGDWRSQTIARETAHLDYADFAQEFLRRNETYQHDYDDMVRCMKTGTSGENACADLARRWGLVLPGQSHCLRCTGARPLAT